MVLKRSFGLHNGMSFISYRSCSCAKIRSVDCDHGVGVVIEVANELLQAVKAADAARQAALGALASLVLVLLQPGRLTGLPCFLINVK